MEWPNEHNILIIKIYFSTDSQLQLIVLKGLPLKTVFVSLQCFKVSISQKLTTFTCIATLSISTITVVTFV